MTIKQFRTIGPVMLESFTVGEVETIKKSISRPGSKIKYIIVCEATASGGESACMCAKADDKMSVALWAKELGVAKLRDIGMTGSTDMKQAVLDCRAMKGHYERFGGAYTRRLTGKPVPDATNNKKKKQAKKTYADASTQTESEKQVPPVKRPSYEKLIDREEWLAEGIYLWEIQQAKHKAILARPCPPPAKPNCSEWEEDEVWRWEVEQCVTKRLLDIPRPTNETWFPRPPK